MQRRRVAQWTATLLLLSTFILLDNILQTSNTLGYHRLPILHNEHYPDASADSSLMYVQVPPLVPVEVQKLIDIVGPDNNELFIRRYLSKKSTVANEKSTVEHIPPIPRTQSTNGTVDVELLKELMDLISTPTYPCAKLLKQGGRTCQRIPDGDKKLCMDEAVAPELKSCLVYSFGIGHDLTFDFAMTDLGCEVFAFDYDSLHAHYDRNQAEKLHIGHVRLGKAVEYRTEINKVTHENFTYFYRPIDNIMYLLYHENSTVDLLKMDIEGSEWEVLEESLFKVDVLKRTRQLALEIHMEQFLNANLTASELTNFIAKFARIVKGLRSRGFELAYYEPNFITPAPMAVVAGMSIPIFAEQLWVNRNLRAGMKPTRKYHYNHLMKHLEPEELHLL